MEAKSQMKDTNKYFEDNMTKEEKKKNKQDSEKRQKNKEN